MSLEFTLRKNVRNLSKTDLIDIRNSYSSLMSIRDKRGYNNIAGIHGVPDFDCFHHQSARWHSKGMRLFLPWHRAYLYFFEQSLKDTNPDSNFGIPWWDWTSKKSQIEGIPKYFSEATTSDGIDNPFFKARIHIDFPPVDEETFRNSRPSSELRNLNNAIDILLENTDFGSFSDNLQSIHDRIHVWVGGSMADVRWAGYDPLFWSHHAMVDRIWRLWQLKHGIYNLPSSYLDEVLEPFKLTVREVLDVYTLGYDYAGSSFIENGPGN